MVDFPDAAAAASPNPVTSPASPATLPRASDAAADCFRRAALFRSTALLAFSTCLAN